MRTSVELIADNSSDHVPGLTIYRPDERIFNNFLGMRFPRRNRFISDHIFDTTNVRRTPKQVGSRLQQLRETCPDAKSLSIYYLLPACRTQFATAVQGLICGTHLPRTHGEAFADPSVAAPVPRRRRRRPALARRKVSRHTPSVIAAASKTRLRRSDSSTQVANLVAGGSVDEYHPRPQVLSNLISVPRETPACSLCFVHLILESAPWPRAPPTVNLMTTTPSESTIRLATISDQFFYPYSRILFAMNPTINFTSPCTLKSKCTFEVFYDGEESPFHYEVGSVTYHQSSRYSATLVPKLWAALCAMTRKAVCISVIVGSDFFFDTDVGQIKIIQNLYPAYNSNPICIIYTFQEVAEQDSPAVSPVAMETYDQYQTNFREHTPAAAYSTSESKLIRVSRAKQTNGFRQYAVPSSIGRHSYVYNTDGELISSSFTY